MECKTKYPIDRKDFDQFITDTEIFKMTRAAMKDCLENWYMDEPEHFTEDMRADLDTVVKTYHFYNEGVSISRTYSDIYAAPLDYISCRIRITDEEDDVCMTYAAFFDEDLTIFDDSIS